MKYLTPELDRAIRQVLRDCGQQAKYLAAQPFTVDQKGPEDYVTDVDRALDRQLAAAFATLCPTDGVVTEESAQSRQAFQAGHARLWFIDPVDGTEDFIHGRPHYSVMAGLLQGHQPKAGWVYAPMQDQMYYGGPEWGLFQAKGQEGADLLVPVEPEPPSETFCPLLVGDRDQANFGEALRAEIPAAQFASLGSFGLKVLEVIQGRAGLYLYLNGRVKLWDTTGPVALALAAGLVCCDLDGQPLQFTPEAIDSETLIHHQPILIGWPSYVTALRPSIQAAAARVLAR
ncbi:3'(2'),5'-bisphosphate nucleotidase CysQ [Geitlerinema sp. PCC 7407]|uniref:3'(2'),5'-bisphosphate nucleotidase CysQ family protein n=1 Tax=Geitlerinema sp. PCC 7407 TaxID=1173025 RepID=UPI00029FA97A|nr:inositol monophosphatase family protein [Geitlerinema sp. PCC 7407]AFY65238.1 3'(2'),5'-bisphosphate nucleotidase [Geitlerinema sp. PCC 7407]